MSINLNYIALKSKKETAVCEALFYVKYLKFTCVEIFLSLFTLQCKDYHYIQLLLERLSEKVHATIPKASDWDCFWVHCSSKKFERMAREAVDLCLRVLKESNKSRFDSYSVRNRVLIISHITFRYCRVHMFCEQPFSRMALRIQRSRSLPQRLIGLKQGKHARYVIYWLYIVFINIYSTSDDSVY